MYCGVLTIPVLKSDREASVHQEAHVLKALPLEVEPITVGNGGDPSAVQSCPSRVLKVITQKGVIILQLTRLSVGVIASKNRLEGCMSIAS